MQRSGAHFMIQHVMLQNYWELSKGVLLASGFGKDLMLLN
jgi:hypothetical protein